MIPIGYIKYYLVQCASFTCFARTSMPSHRMPSKKAILLSEVGSGAPTPYRNKQVSACETPAHLEAATRDSASSHHGPSQRGKKVSTNGTVQRSLPQTVLGVCAAEGRRLQRARNRSILVSPPAPRGATLGLSVLPNCPRFSHVSLRRLLPRRLLAEASTTQLACAAQGEAADSQIAMVAFRR